MSLHRTVGNLVCTQEQADVANVVLLAEDLNDGAGANLAYSTALKTLDQTGRPAADGVAPIAAPNTLGTVTAEELRLKLRSVVREAKEIVQSRAKARRSLGDGPGGGDDTLDAAARRLLGRDAEEQTMDKSMAKDLIALAAAQGDAEQAVRVPTAAVLVPGPAALTKARRSAMSARAAADSRTKPRYPTAEAMPALSIDTMSEDMRLPFEGKAANPAAVERAQRMKLLAVRIVTSGQEVPRTITARDASSGGYLLSNSAHYAMLDHIEEAAVTFGDDAAGLAAHYSTLDKALHRHTADRDFSAAYKKAVVDAEEHLLWGQQLQRAKAAAAPAPRTPGAKAPRDVLTPGPGAATSASAAQKEEQKKAKKAWKAAHGIASETPVYSDGKGGFTTQAPPPRKPTTTKAAAPQAAAPATAHAGGYAPHPPYAPPGAHGAQLPPPVSGGPPPQARG